jgi:hypothetical protein
MESVETVLEMYGGPEDLWKDTFRVPRDLEDFELNQVSFYGREYRRDIGGFLRIR